MFKIEEFIKWKPSDATWIKTRRHLYESKKSFERWWKYHVNWAETYRTGPRKIIGYRLGKPFRTWEQ